MGLERQIQALRSQQAGAIADARGSAAPGNRFATRFGRGFDPGLMKKLLDRAQSQAGLIGQETTNRTSQAFKSRGIPSAAIADAVGVGARAETNALGQLSQPIELGNAQAAQQGGLAGAGLDIGMFDILRRRQDAIQAAKAGKTSGIDFGKFGGISF